MPDGRVWQPAGGLLLQPSGDVGAVHAAALGRGRWGRHGGRSNSLQPPGRGPPRRAGQGGLCLPSLLPLLCLPVGLLQVGLAGHEQGLFPGAGHDAQRLVQRGGPGAGQPLAHRQVVGAGRPEAQRGGPGRRLAGLAAVGPRPLAGQLPPQQRVDQRRAVVPVRVTVLLAGAAGLAQAGRRGGLPEAGAEQPAAGGAGKAAAARGARVPGVLAGQRLGELGQVPHEGAAQALAPAGPLLGQVGVVRGHFLGLVNLELGVELLQLVLGARERAGVRTILSIPWLRCSAPQLVLRPFFLGERFPTKPCPFLAFKTLRKFTSPFLQGQHQPSSEPGPLNPEDAGPCLLPGTVVWWAVPAWRPGNLGGLVGGPSLAHRKPGFEAADLWYASRLFSCPL